MSSEELRALLTKVEAAYTKRLLISWYRDPEAFPEWVRQLEEIIDLKRKLWPDAG
jgi:hypothetical protein